MSNALVVCAVRPDVTMSVWCPVFPLKPSKVHIVPPLAVLDESHPVPSAYPPDGSDPTGIKEKKKRTHDKSLLQRPNDGETILPPTHLFPFYFFSHPAFALAVFRGCVALLALIIRLGWGPLPPHTALRTRNRHAEWTAVDVEVWGLVTDPLMIERFWVWIVGGEASTSLHKYVSPSTVSLLPCPLVPPLPPTPFLQAYARSNRGRFPSYAALEKPNYPARSPNIIPSRPSFFFFSTSRLVGRRIDLCRLLTIE